MKKVWILAVAVMLIPLAACGRTGLDSAVKKGALAPQFADTKLDKEFLWVRGIGAANPDFKSDTQKRALSREAAISNAYQRAGEFLKGAALQGKTQVENAVVTNQDLLTQINAVVQGGEIFSSEYLEDGGCTVIMRISRKDMEKVGITLPGAN